MSRKTKIVYINPKFKNQYPSFFANPIKKDIISENQEVSAETESTLYYIQNDQKSQFVEVPQEYQSN